MKKTDKLWISREGDATTSNYVLHAIALFLVLPAVTLLQVFAVKLYFWLN